MIPLSDGPQKIIIGRKYSDCLKKPLKQYFSSVIEMPDNPFVDSRLSGHMDISVLRLDEHQVLIPINLQGSEIEKTLVNSSFSTVYTQKEQGSRYPDDVLLNVCECGDYLIYNPRTVDGQIEILFQNKKKITVNQGYTGCSVCRIGEDSIITSDSSIHSAAEKAGLNSLLISPGFIELDGFDYGFIGGAAFMYDGKLLFTGLINNHPSYNEIASFLNNLSIEFEPLTDRTIFDIGGVLITGMTE